jgi:hypothetical protein
LVLSRSNHGILGRSTGVEPTLRAHRSRFRRPHGDGAQYARMQLDPAGHHSPACSEVGASRRRQGSVLTCVAGGRTMSRCRSSQTPGVHRRPSCVKARRGRPGGTAFGPDAATSTICGGSRRGERARQPSAIVPARARASADETQGLPATAEHSGTDHPPTVRALGPGRRDEPQEAHHALRRPLLVVADQR